MTSTFPLSIWIPSSPGSKGSFAEAGHCVGEVGELKSAECGERISSIRASVCNGAINNESELTIYLRILILFIWQVVVGETKNKVDKMLPPIKLLSMN